MGVYLNPGNSGFERIIRGRYVDKTGMIRILNNMIGTTDNLLCISRPRRFGKSFAAQMLCAYYDFTCDSHSQFDKLCISNDPAYEKHLNQYQVIYLDITSFISEIQREKNSLEDVPNEISNAIKAELLSAYPFLKSKSTLSACFIECVEKIGKPFIFIIDEWDALIREAKNDLETQKKYFYFLRGLFKNGNFTPHVVAAAYMTGILPIKKDGTQSAISDFREYTMIKPLKFGEYVGFTEKEVRDLCNEYEVNLQTMKQWYDGYSFRDVGPVYNPNSVIQAIENHDFDSYWTETSSAEVLMEYISKGYSGLTQAIAELIGGVEVAVNTNGFANDLSTFRSKDDVLTLLIHLGYLAYDAEKGTVHIPNEEIRMEFAKSVREVDHMETLRRLSESDQLILDTIHENEDAVAAQIEKVHSEETVPLHYNKEDSLRSVIKLAYYTYRDHYLQLEELPAGDGYADIVYMPKPGSDYPALVVELKWHKTAEGAIHQILDKKYTDVLKGYDGEILLVGVNYDKNAPAGKYKHTCIITRMK